MTVLSVPPSRVRHYLPPRRKERLLNLIGKRCLIHCQLDAVPVEALWDTGTQACVINEEWRKLNRAGPGKSGDPSTRVGDRSQSWARGDDSGSAATGAAFDPQRAPQAAGQECWRCGQLGHFRGECPLMEVGQRAGPGKSGDPSTRVGDRSQSWARGDDSKDRLCDSLPAEPRGINPATLNLPHHTVRPLDELLGSEQLIGVGANQTQIPFLGWVEVRFRLGRDSALQEPLLVPILVSSDTNVAEQPIIGYNVIEEVVGEVAMQNTV
ncbi:hypothetical protein N1851_009618 [Merluccius polli]|uniref:CCHC-type domain-containing protein n=1 Tax=Merluccius polli TaxID=89951 RepID=A0AA47MZK2_MERPO|nr:hypothetical protein N1851_009618 [Merluccius polli]